MARRDSGRAGSPASRSELPLSPILVAMTLGMAALLVGLLAAKALAAEVQTAALPGLEGAYSEARSTLKAAFEAPSGASASDSALEGVPAVPPGRAVPPDPASGAPGVEFPPASRLADALPADLFLVELAAREALSQGVDPLLVLAVIKEESDFRPGIVSRRGARGLMQVLPETAALFGVRRRELLQPAANLKAGVAYLRILLARFDKVEHAVAAYNTGPNRVEAYDDIPPYRETRLYVRDVLSTYEGLKLVVAQPRTGLAR